MTRKADPPAGDVLRAWTASASQSAFLEALGLNAKSDKVAHRLMAECGLEDPAPHWTTRGCEPEPDLPPEEAHERDKAIARKDAELKDLKKRYEAAVKDAVLTEDILATAHEVFGREAPIKARAPHIGRSDIREDAILGWADWHGGEVVDYDVMQGYNAYDPFIMCRRAQQTVDKTLSILFEMHTGTTFERLWVFDLGDSINGDHLREQLATNAATVFECMRMVALVKARALNELAAHIPVTYLCVPGNHGRRGQKMEWKLPTETADWLIGQMIADRTADNERIDCFVPRAWTAGVTIRGYNHVLNHGYSSASGGYGGISWYAIMRSDGQKTAIEAAHGKRVHNRWYGHIHQKAEIPMMDGEGEQHIIGSLKGGDEYALEKLNKYAPATQKLVGCHEDHPVSWRYPLTVTHGDEEPSRYEELVGEFVRRGARGAA